MYNFHVLIDVYTNGYQLVILNVISVLSILCGISVIIAKNPIVSILCLIGLFFTIALYLMALGLNFIGLSYLLVYVGAVSILFLFILMLINVRISELVTDNNNSLILGILTGLLIVTPIYAKGSYSSIENKSMSYYTDVVKLDAYPALNDVVEQTANNKPWSLFKDLAKSLKNIFQDITQFEDKNVEYIYFVTSKMWDGTLGEMSHITSIGNIIYTSYPLWLIITSIILLLAMVGAIVITIKQ